MRKSAGFLSEPGALSESYSLVLDLASCVILDNELHVTGHGDLCALRTTQQGCLQLVELDLEVSRNRGKHLCVAASCGDLELLGALRLWLHVDELTRLHAERGAVDELAVNKNVAVHNHLASLCGGAGDACTQHKSVETHLKQLDQVLTGQAILATCFLERNHQL